MKSKIIGLMLATALLASCKKEDTAIIPPTMDDGIQVNDVAFYFDNNSKLLASGNKVIGGEMEKGDLVLSVNKDDLHFRLRLKKYDLKKDGDRDLDNTTAILQLAMGKKEYSSQNIFIPLYPIFDGPTTAPVFAEDKLINMVANNRIINDSTTDVRVYIHPGSEVIDIPFWKEGIHYNAVGFINAGDNNPNLLQVRVKL